MSQIKENNQNHRGHRQRVRDRYIENGISALAEHEILEMILFYAVPRVDTKPIAYNLINTYGSLEAVFSASHESLVSFGLSSSQAVLLKVIGDVGGWMEKEGMKGRTALSYNEIGELFVKELANDKAERFVMLMLDSKGAVIGLETLSTGSFAAASIDTRKIAVMCIERNAAKIAFAHNHPMRGGIASVNDHSANNILLQLCSMIGVQMVEHFVVTGNTFLGIKRMITNTISSYEPFDE